jgi:hypothetical protein
MTAVTALHEQLAGFGCPAPDDRIDGAQMAGHRDPYLARKAS